MSDSKARNNLHSSNRIESIDVLRGIIILAMIFVNDIAGVKDTPSWMMHMPTFSDGMTFVDLVFPAFLFIVGMSMPFSIGKRLERKDKLYSIWKHILIRVFGLLLLGFYMVNGDKISYQESLINPHLWAIIMYLSIIVVWNKAHNERKIISGKYYKYFAIAVLITLAFIYRGTNIEGVFQMRPYWWGILGLIGWAYLVASLVYILFRNNPDAILGSIVLLYIFYMTDEAGMTLQVPVINDLMRIGYTLGTHSAIVLTGAMLGNKIKENASSDDKTIIVKWALGFSICLLITGMMLNSLSSIHRIFFISKNLGTVPWGLISSALTIWLWLIIYWTIDLKGNKLLSKIVEPAGTNPLFAYILAPLVVEIVFLVSHLVGGINIYGWLGQTFPLGFLRAIILAFSMTWFAGFLSSHGVQLKL